MRSLALVLMLMGGGTLSFSQNIWEKEKAPDFVLKSLNNEWVRLSEYKGKVVLLNFWATWCAPCKAEIPEMVNWQEQYRKQGLKIIGITYPPYKTRSVRQITKELRINYPIVFASKKIAQLYGVGDVLPVTIIIDQEGSIRDRILGIIDAEEFEQKVKPLIE